MVDSNDYSTDIKQQIVDRSNLKTPLNEQAHHIKNLHTPGWKRIITLSIFSIFFIFFTMLLVFKIDLFMHDLLKYFKSNNPSIILYLLFTMFSIFSMRWTLRTPPPGGASSLLGGRDNETWSVIFSWKSIIIITVIAIISSFTFFVF